MEASAWEQNFSVSDRHPTRCYPSRRLNISAEAGLVLKMHTKQKKENKCIVDCQEREKGGCVYLQDNEHIIVATLLVMLSTVAAKVNGEFKPSSVLMEGLLRRVTVCVRL